MQFRFTGAQPAALLSSNDLWCASCSLLEQRVGMAAPRAARAVPCSACPVPTALKQLSKIYGTAQNLSFLHPGGSRGLITTLQMQQGHAGLIYHRRAAARRLPASLGPAGDCRAYRRAKGQGRLIYHIRNPLSPLREVFCYQSVFQIRNKTSKKPKKKKHHHGTKKTTRKIKYVTTAHVAARKQNLFPDDELYFACNRCSSLCLFSA